MAATLGVVAEARVARAQGPTASVAIEVEWTAPPECPRGSQVRDRVLARVAQGSDAEMRARASGHVERHDGGYRVVLSVETAASRGERTLDASSCEDLATSAAVVIAMSIASAANDAPPPPPAAPPRSPLSASPGAEGASAQATERDAKRVHVRVQAVGDGGFVPAFAFGAGLAFGATVTRSLMIEAHGSFFAPKDGTLEGASTRGAAFSLFTTGARACWSLTRGVELMPCVGLELQRVSASGFGAVRVADATSLSLGPEALVAGRVPLGPRFSFRVGAGALVPMSRQSFVINAGGTVFTPSVVAFRAWAGPEVRF